MPKISNQNEHPQSWILRLNNCMKVFNTIVGEMLFIWMSRFLQNLQKISSAILFIPCKQIAYTFLLTFGLTLACMCWMRALSYGRKVIMHVCYLYRMPCAIWYHLFNLRAETCNFTKVTLLHECQIAIVLASVLISPKKTTTQQFFCPPRHWKTKNFLRQTKSPDHSNVFHMFNNYMYTDFATAYKHFLIASYLIRVI